MDIKQGEFIFFDNSNSLGKFLTRNMYKCTNKNISVDIIRHSYISNLCSNNKLTLAKRKRTAQLMGHSVIEQLCYNKIS